ncbi:hypothetical protein KC19_VG204400 [Ceratodon purpureus]|uniref:Secreted protein n=1 Tax=Ceratodon purpureus TaxID=3225 RepID=A0A8T0HSJ6_CERPU|nr:hypothetical protein KC19_VG204400 [Ceratodon purpureus]
MFLLMIAKVLFLLFCGVSFLNSGECHFLLIPNVRWIEVSTHQQSVNPRAATYGSSPLSYCKTRLPPPHMYECRHGGYIYDTGT